MLWTKKSQNLSLMSSRSLHLLSIIHLCVSALVCIAGGLLLTCAYLPHLRFGLADRIIEDDLFLLLSGVGVFVVEVVEAVEFCVCYYCVI